MWCYKYIYIYTQIYIIYTPRFTGCCPSSTHSTQGPLTRPPESCISVPSLLLLVLGERHGKSWDINRISVDIK